MSSWLGRSLSLQPTERSGNEVTSGYLGASLFSRSVGVEGGFQGRSRTFITSRSAARRIADTPSDNANSSLMRLSTSMAFCLRSSSAGAKRPQRDPTTLISLTTRRSRFYLRRAVKCRFQNEHAARMQKFNCKREAGGRSGCLDDDSEFSFALLSLVDRIRFDPTSLGNGEFVLMLSD